MRPRPAKAERWHRGADRHLKKSWSATVASADLYALLGVQRDATTAQSRTAYRKAAKMAHPDQPSGSKEKFGALKLAHDILTDDERRKKYDETGDASEKQPNNKQADMMNALGQYLMEALGRPDAETTDLVAYMTKRINGQILENMAKLSQVQDQIAHLKRMRKRFKAKKGKEDVLGLMVDNMIGGADVVIATTKRNIESLQEIAKVIQDHTFAADVPTPTGWSIGTAGMFRNSTGGL